MLTTFQSKNKFTQGIALRVYDLKRSIDLLQQDKSAILHTMKNSKWSLLRVSQLSRPQPYLPKHHICDMEENTKLPGMVKIWEKDGMVDYIVPSVINPITPKKNCYEIIGYPPGWRRHKLRRKSAMAPHSQKHSTVSGDC
ncbi:hypothetical protein RJ639_016979 [Escallonia herrerae]|uniref:Uncharacterized protein n=1 Tax=Escallonia herrerae TaxID=1293975 RepID=A0AA88VE18_9ASTE|nr:hypothetical protein RJ639_016979 [Escallonia herrerae]